VPKVLITTIPFGAKDRHPLDRLEQENIEYVINPLGRKLKGNELVDLIEDYDGLIAGTELISLEAMKKAPRLKFISRVGIGLDGVDLLSARDLGIKVSYTPDAPAPAVAELTMGHMLSLARHIHLANEKMHQGEWNRIFGRRLAESTIGLIGFGRIGQRVFQHLSGFFPKRILVNDTDEEIVHKFKGQVEFVSKEEIYRESDIISLHIPLTFETTDMIKREQLLSMKKDCLLINTSRGGIINEDDLNQVLNEGHLEGAGIDVFVQEPYGERALSKNPKCLLTSHMGSMSVDCRTTMEIEATDEIIRYFKGEELMNVVPEYEYKLHEKKLR
jgi:D-3-phosphoglycerate dehydrogenase